ncbi:MAG: Tryptophan synthase alpha chain [Thermomicrobiales bacterium]|jgi:hypothetical protein|nr:Tryptophan synthase alpha chain [Thermomicrobiales bacterium]
MDERNFDRWAMSLSQHSTRRAALRWAASSLLGGLLGSRGASASRAQDACGGCPPGYFCSAGGVCLVESALDRCLIQGLRDCGGVCVDIQEDARHCGGCGVVCGDGQSCAEGRCFVFDDLNCAAQGLTNCGGRCTDLALDYWNCGACGKSCPIGSICADARCVSSGARCTVLGLVECEGFCVDTINDPDHCGGCEFACYVEGARCVNGRCIS